MQLLSTLVGLAAVTSALSIPRSEPVYILELAPGETRTATEAEKWALKAAGVHFMDITDYQELASGALRVDIQKRATPVYPSSVAQTAAVKALIPSLNKSNLQTALTTFSNFFNRYYRSTYGAQSSVWLQGQIQSIIDASGASGVTVKPFAHSWNQSSLIATIPGKSSKTIVLGAHQDSININDPVTGRAPGADDDGSASVTILEAFRVLLQDSKVAAGQAENTIEFHWYSAEEAGLLGSQAIFTQYAKDKRDVKAMLQQDMTGYTKGTTNAGKTPSIGVFTDYVDASLTAFIMKVVTAYCTIPYVTTKCGYACSDHASATKAGYPSALVSEAAFENTSPYLHTTSDTLSTVDFDHVLEHAKMTLGLAYELGFATL
ncbi:transferrin receptor [Thozetella sp. PMI_491]|nr:transferrin receptor [Thozetella sp. PMI_491]